MDEKCSDLRRQILVDVLGDQDHVEEYENFNKPTNTEKPRPAHRQRIPLWQFLLHLLRRDKQSRFIKWNTDRDLEFRILDTIGVAALWGSVKNKTDMTYEKLGRAMRYYYGKSIIEKVSGRRYTYRFILSRRTKKYLSKFMTLTNDVQNVQANQANTSCETKKYISKFMTLANEVQNVQANQANTSCEGEDDDSCSDSVVPDSRPGTPEDLENDSPVPSPTRYEETSTVELSIKKEKHEEYEHSSPNSSLAELHQKPVKVKPVKPKPIQSIMKTKIFKPEEVMGNFSQKPFTHTFSESRRSAFLPPNKMQRNADSCTTKIFQALPVLERIPYTYDDVVLSGTRKRKIVCYCGNPACSERSDSNIKDNVSVSDGNVSPDDITVKEIEYPKVGRVWSNDFILRRDIVEKQGFNLQKLQQKLKLQRRADPFMGFDVYRLESDYERSEQYYDSLDDYDYDIAVRRHAWAA